MTLNELANIAEIFGMLVVGVTLIFLTLQTRQSTRAMRATTNHSVNEMALAIYTPIVASDDLAELLLRGLRDPEKLSDVEMARFTAHWQNAFFTWQNWFYQRHVGDLDDEIWSGFTKLLGDVMTTPGLQRFWHDRRSYFSRGFREYMESELAAKETTPGYKVLGAGPAG